MNTIVTLATDVVGFAAGSFIGRQASQTIKTYLHEASHVCAINLLFNNACAKIVLNNYGYKGAITNWHSDQPRFPRFPGHRASRGMVAAAGPLGDLIQAFALRLLLPRSFFCEGFIQQTTNKISNYALTTLNLLGLYDDSFMDSGPQSDFIKLKRECGIVPCAFLMTASIGVDWINLKYSFDYMLDHFCHQVLENQHALGLEKFESAAKSIQSAVPYVTTAFLICNILKTLFDAYCLHYKSQEISKISDPSTKQFMWQSL